MNENKKINVAVLIDGFNFYHAICKHMETVNYPKNLKWLDYDALIRNVLLKNTDINNLSIRFYTAKNTFKQDNQGNPHKSIQNHDIYISALKSKNIEVIEGVFKFRDEKLNSYIVCKSCQHPQFIHKLDVQLPNRTFCVKCKNEILPEDFTCIKKVEEKKTDVQIAIDLVNIARDGNYDKIFLLSTDSDFIPPAEYIKNNCPDVDLIIVAPSDKVKQAKYNSKTKQIEHISRFRYGTSEFQKLGICVLRLKLSKLINCLLDDKLILEDCTVLRNPWLNT